RFGHRGSQEMELASPRWNEDPAAVDALAGASAAPGATDGVGADEQAQVWDRIAVELKLLPNQRTILARELQDVRTYLALRETAKHHLLRGYALIRRYLVALDRRFQLDGGVFFLEPDELSCLVDSDPDDVLLGEQMRALIEQRRARRRVAL